MDRTGLLQEQTEDAGWTYGRVLYHKYPVTHIDGYDAKVTMATVTKTEEEVKELLRKRLRRFNMLQEETDSTSQKCGK